MARTVVEEMADYMGLEPRITSCGGATFIVLESDVRLAVEALGLREFRGGGECDELRRAVAGVTCACSRLSWYVAATMPDYMIWSGGPSAVLAYGDPIEEAKLVVDPKCRCQRWEPRAYRVYELSKHLLLLMGGRRGNIVAATRYGSLVSIEPHPATPIILEDASEYVEWMREVDSRIETSEAIARILEEAAEHGITALISTLTRIMSGGG